MKILGFTFSGDQEKKNHVEFCWCLFFDARILWAYEAGSPDLSRIFKGKVTKLNI